MNRDLASRPLRVLHINGLNLNTGAARGVYWLHKALMKQGVESRILISETDTNESEIQALARDYIETIKWKLRIRLEDIPKKIYYTSQKPLIFSTGLFGFPITKHPWYDWADIINLHWTNNATVSLSETSRIRKPLVWTMRDMWLMTGGCHCSLECEKYKEGCGQCPQLGSLGWDISKWIVQRKKRLLPAKLNLVTLSTWQKESAQTSIALQGYNINVIPNCIDTDIFYPIPKELARKALKLPLNVPIVLSGSLGDEPWKGWDKFIQAVSFLPDNVQIVLFGGNLSIQGRINLIHYGLIKNDNILRNLYSAADIYLFTSIQEALGKTVIEAMACGTPVVAFDATGPKDIIKNYENGLKVTPFQSEELAKGVQFLLDNEPLRLKMGRMARETVLREYSFETVAKQYILLYKSIV